MVHLPSRVFVSYAREDGTDFARLLVTELAERGIEAWLDEREMYGGHAWRRQLVEAIEQAEYVVLVMTPGTLSSEAVAWEWQTARRLGVCVFPVRADAMLDVAAAPLWMRDLHWYTLDTEWASFVEHLRAPCQVDRVPSMARELPSGHITRWRELATAKETLLQDNASVVLHGPPGYGKTTLALALCHDDEVGASFHGGVLWVSLGQRPNLLAEVDRVHLALTGRPSGAADLDGAARVLHDRLRDRRCLLVVDDVWRKSDLNPFGDAYVVTTRRFDVAVESAGRLGPGGRPGRLLEVDTMTDSEAQHLITADLHHADVTQFGQLVERLSGWPLLVTLARGALRTRIARGATPEAALAALGEALDRRHLTAFDASDPDERNDAVAASVAVSLDLLAEDDVARWTELAVFPEDTPVPLGTVAQLWNEDSFGAEELAGRLADASLLQLDLGDGTIEVHDVLLAAAQQRARDEAALHRRLIGAWGDLRDLDGYGWRWIVHHLAGAGEEARLRDLLLDPPWLTRRLAATTVETLLADFDLIVQEQPYLLVREALRLSSKVLARDSAQLPGQLRARLLSVDVPGLAEMLDLAGRQPGLVPLRASLQTPGAEPGEQVPVATLTVADGGAVVVSGSGDGVLVVWDVRSAAVVRTITEDRADADPSPAPWEMARPPTWGGHRGPLLAGFPDRRVAASSGGKLTVWDLDRGTRLRVLETGAPVTALAVSPDGRHVVAASGASLRFWDQRTDSVREVASNRITTLAFAGSEVVVSGSSHLDGALAERSIGGFLRVNALRVWEVPSGRLLRTLEGHPCGVNALAARGRLVASAPNPGLYAFEDTCPRLWDLETGTPLRAFERHGFTVRSVAITPDERFVVSGGGGCFQRYGPEFLVKVWNLHTGELLRHHEGHEGPVVGVVVTPDSRWVVTAGGRCEHHDDYAADGSIRVWDVERGGLAATFQGDEAATAVVLPDPQTVVAGAVDGAVHILRWRAGGG